MGLRYCAFLAAAALAIAAPAAMSAPCTGYGVPDDPPPGQNGNVSIAVCSFTNTIDAITEVEIIGPGGGLFAFADPLTGPLPAETGVALAAALAGLGLPTDTPAQLNLTGPVKTESFTQTVEALYSPSAVLYGDPDDYTTWIAEFGNINVNVTLTTTELYAYRLEARIGDVSAIPLPASAFLLLGGLAGIGGLRLRRKAS